MKNWLTKYGIRGDVAFQRLLYNTPSDKLIAHVQHNPTSKPVSRLYVRDKSEQTYRMIGRPEKNISYDTPVTSQTSPILYFNIWKSERKGYWWKGIGTANLKTGNVSTICKEEDLIWPNHCRGGWIRELTDMTNDEKGLLCVVGYELPHETEPESWRVEYWLCDLRLETLTIENIAVLEASFL
jgi:hypothetical protein